MIDLWLFRNDLEIIGWFFTTFQELVMDRKPKPSYARSLTGCVTIFLKSCRESIKFIKPLIINVLH
jgi:hypothetical protein